MKEAAVASHETKQWLKAETEGLIAVAQDQSLATRSSDQRTS